MGGMCQIIGTMKPPFITIDAQGRATLTAEAPHQVASGPASTYGKKPVQVKLRHDLVLEMHGEHFKTACALDVDDALALIGSLSYLLREKLYLDSLRDKQDGADA